MSPQLWQRQREQMIPLKSPGILCNMYTVFYCVLSINRLHSYEGRRLTGILMTVTPVSSPTTRTDTVIPLASHYIDISELEQPNNYQDTGTQSQCLSLSLSILNLYIGGVW